VEDAKNAWHELVDRQWQEKLAPSPWAQLVQEKLKQIS